MTGVSMKFTKDQVAAIRHKGHHLQLIACAGSGKTEVVARRVVHLLDAKRGEGLLPRNIVAFTFTEKAAAELKDRILTRTGEALGEVTGMAELFVGTIHGFCLELLHTESPMHLKYEVLNEVQQALLIDRNSRKSGLTASTDLDGNPLKRYTDTSHYVNALAMLREATLVRKHLAGCSVVDGLVAYQALLQEKCYLDYSSILSEAVALLQKKSAVQAHLKERLRYVIVDEYQDVNPVQETLINTLSKLGARICVVGDDDQTLYQWRGSDVQNILTFSERYPGTDRIRMQENFRSSPGIVEMARKFIAQNAERLDKAMLPTTAQMDESGDLVGLSFDNPVKEANHIVATIQALRGVAFHESGTERGLAYSDMAILLRSVRKNADPITKALKTAGIPFVVSGMTGLFGAREAEAARQLFYFMAGRDGVDEGQVRSAWMDAGLGLRIEALKVAVDGAVTAREALELGSEGSWGVYSIQRVYQTFLEQAGVREDAVPDERGEIVFANLGKFSQVISDFESIHFHSRPGDKFQTFADFLHYRAQEVYPEGWQDNQYVSPDAVRIMTIHQAKGMQWPVVFLPAMLKNRFPSGSHGGRNVWHLLPKQGIKGHGRYLGSLEDERRLFYVALTRSQKFLHVTWAPIPGNRLYQYASPFWVDILASKHLKRRPQDYSQRKRIKPQPRQGVASVTFTFSDLKYFFECPYQFKLRLLYGFNPPIHEALGYGKSLHDALAEVHSRAIRGEMTKVSEAKELVQTHLHVPYAYPALRGTLTASAEQAVANYLRDNAAIFRFIEFSEQPIVINMGNGVTVNGRIDLVRRIDTGETTIVDLKSTERAQAEEVTETQLHIYALGYQDLTGNRPDFVETYNLDSRKRKPRSVDDDFIGDVQSKIRNAAEALRGNQFVPLPSAKKCSSCDFKGMCGSQLPCARTGRAKPMTHGQARNSSGKGSHRSTNGI